MSAYINDRRIKDLKVWSIQKFLKKIGIDIKVDGDAKNFEELRILLEAYNFDNLWDYPLEDLEHCNENNLNVVILYCDDGQRLWEY